MNIRKSNLITRGFLSLAILFCLFLCSLTVRAQNFESRSFLAGSIRSLTISNGISFTNISSRGVSPTNLANTVWTNYAGTQIVAGTNQTTTKLMQDIDLYSLRDGNAFGQTNAANAGNIIPVNCSLGITIIGGSGADTAATFKFRPLYDGTNEVTEAGKLWTFTVTPNGATAVCIATNPPLHLWSGCRKMRCVEITAGDTDASSSFTILNMSLNGFVP